MLTTRVIDARRPGPHLLVTAGVHGDEYEGPCALWKLAENPVLAGLRGRLTLVPVVNEAAFARGQRCADDGLDLARTCPGRPDGSATEQVAHDLCQLIRAADYYVDLHSGGNIMSVWPLTGYMLHPQPDVLDKQRAMARSFNLPVIWGTDPTLDGRSLSVARDANVPAIYAEYEGGGRLSPRGIEAYESGCLNLMAHLGMIDRPAPATQIEYFVEDARSGSGHMQRCYPSPFAGFFEPVVELGQRISAGHVLGSVYGPTGQRLHTVVSQHTGLALVLRVLPLVQAGDALAVILEC